MDMNKLTIKAQEALGAAQNLALTRGHQEVDAEHLALALLRQQEGLVHPVRLGQYADRVAHLVGVNALVNVGQVQRCELQRRRQVAVLFKVLSRPL